VAHANLGMMLARLGQTDKALVHMRKVAKDKPNAPEAHRDLGHALADKGAYREASVELEEASRLSAGRDPLTLHLLGRVYANLGRATEALRIQREALSIAMQQNNAKLIEIITAQLGHSNQGP
jgi:Flp pilus assembly protein TadD